MDGLRLGAGLELDAAGIFGKYNHGLKRKSQYAGRWSRDAVRT